MTTPELEKDGPRLRRLEAEVARLQGELGEAREAAVADRKAFEVRLEALTDYKRDFVNMLTHDLRNPLTGVISALSSLQLMGESWPEAERSRWIGSALGAARQVNAMLDDLLDVAKLEAGRYVPVSDPVDLAEILEAALVPVRPMVDARRLRLEVRLPAEGAWVLGEAGKLQRVLANLLSNAVKYTARGGVFVSLASEGGAVRLQVADTGPGIPAGARAGLFEKFYRAAPQEPGMPGGTGLGLAFCRQMVLAHGGTIAIDTPSDLAATALGIPPVAPGALFTVLLPAAPPET